VGVPTPEELEFAERIGLFFEMMGSQRTAGRIYGWLMVCDPPHHSIAELASALGVSKASISTLGRQLEQAQLIERVPVAHTRQHHYQVRPGGWAQILRARVARLKPAADAAEYGLSVIGEDRPEQRERVQELRDFMTFAQQQYGEDHVRHWEEYRKRARDTRVEGRDG
jgi:DNA-binding transcriptional regulator GbsR (MarR family)